MYYISKTAVLKFRKSFVIVGLGINQFIVNYDDGKIYADIMHFCMHGKTLSDIKKYLISNNIDKKYFKTLIDKHLIVSHSYNYNEIDKDPAYKNKLFLDTVLSNADVALKNFSKTKFLIIGTGGIGNFISFAVLSFSPKKIILIDGDTIEESNLNRQLFFKYSDIGKKKASVLSSELKKRTKKTTISFYNNYINANNLKKIITVTNKNNFFAIISADSTNTIKTLIPIFVKYKIPFINVGYLNEISSIGPFYINNTTSCCFCGDTLKIEDTMKKQKFIKEIENNYSAPSSFGNNTLPSSMAMSDIISYMANDYKNVLSINKLIGIDNNLFNKFEVKIKKDKNCLYCGKKN